MLAGNDTRGKRLFPTGLFIPNTHILYFILTVILSALVYRITLCPTVEYIDSGELALASKYLGIAHPTGYPLYTILGRLASVFLWGDLINRVNMLSLFFTSLASGFLYLTGRAYITALKLNTRWNGFTSFCIALFASLTPIWWAQGTTNEVYSLNLLLLTISLWTFLKYLNDTKSKWLVFSSYALGLSLTNHLSAVYIIPAFAVVIIYLLRKKRLKGNVLIFIAAFFFFPLSMYLFLPIRARFSPFLNWGGVDDLYFLYKHISGWQYHIWMFSGSDFSISALFDKTASSAALMYRQFGWIGIILSVTGIILSLIRKTYLSIFTLLIIALNFVYASNYDIIDIESYYLPMIIAISLLMGAGTVYPVTIILDVFKNSRPVKYIVLLGIIILPLSNFIDNYYVSDRSNRIFAKQSVMDMLDSMEPGGLALVENWDFYSPWLYFHFEEKLRPDIILLDKELMRRTWYIDFIRRKHSEIYQSSSRAIEDFLEKVRPFERSQPFNGSVIDRAYYNMLHTITLNESDRRPVYTNIMFDSKYSGGLPLIPTGILYKIERSESFVGTELFRFKKELWGSRFIYRDKRIAVILSYYKAAFSSREKYCRYFREESEAEYYKKLTAEVSAVIGEITLKK